MIEREGWHPVTKKTCS